MCNNLGQPSAERQLPDGVELKDPRFIQLNFEERVEIGRVLAADTAFVEAVAEIAHDMNRLYSYSLNGRKHFEHSRWDQASGEQQASCRDGVTTALTMTNPTAAAMHDNWMERKLRDGWRWDENKNESRKTHPCLLPYESLPEGQKQKDNVFLTCIFIAKDLVQQRAKVHNVTDDDGKTRRVVSF